MSQQRRLQQAPTDEPLQPLYILRGHLAQIHALAFIAANSRLITADADGWVVLWNVATRRPLAVWKAHENAVLAVAEWNESGGGGGRRIITSLPYSPQEKTKLTYHTAQSWQRQQNLCMESWATRRNRTGYHTTS